MDERDEAAALAAVQRQIAAGDWVFSRYARQELDAEVSHRRGGITPRSAALQSVSSPAV
ncbi:MAG: hypothetical protein M3Q71_16490 [Chloroflexota bacterium]|nr:hypothetical protein [Chloroflexota bacterium]